MYVIYVIMESMRESRPYSISDLTTLPEQSVVMMAGLPGGDRSHIAKHLGVMLDAQVVSSEAIRNELSGGGSNAVSSQQVLEVIHHRVERGLTEGGSLIIDASHTIEEVRRRDVRVYRKFGAAAVVAVHVISPVEAPLVRRIRRSRLVPDQMVRLMWHNLDMAPPSTDDGYDYVVNINDN